jgi:hypothetical protein
MIVDDAVPPEPTSGPRPVGKPATVWWAVMTVCRIAVPTGFVVMALIGAVVTPPFGMFVVAPLTGSGLGLLVALLNPAFPDERWARRAALLTAATGAAFIPFMSGVTLFGNAGGVFALVLLVLGSGLAADRMMDVVENHPPGSVRRDDHWLRVVMPSLPTAALLQEWRATQAVFGGRRGIAEQTRAAHVRGLLLEELARRDPAAVERWLSSGDWSAVPRIRTDRDVAG